eukprot:2407649-Rhodomonas_salina.2
MNAVEMVDGLARGRKRIFASYAWERHWGTRHWETVAFAIAKRATEGGVLSNWVDSALGLRPTRVVHPCEL